MNYTEHKITLDVNKPASQATISVKKGDTARRLLVNLSESGRPYYISQDCYAVIAATKPDGYVIFNNCTIQDSVIGYDFTAQTVAAVGLMNCEIIVYGKRGLQLTSASFDIIIEDSNFTSVESSSEANAFATLIMEIKALNALGLRAPAIICEAKGENISITDASNEALQGLRIFGKSIQAATPTPENPVEIVNLAAPVVTITDGTDVQTMAITDSLPGIRVTSGGNYTDSDGQQWICDEVDLGRGVYVQRIMKIELSGDEGFSPGTRGTFNLTLTNAMLVDVNNQDNFVGVLCDSYVANAWDKVASKGQEGCALMWGHGIGFRDKRFSSVSEFTAFLSENPVTVFYILEDPIEIPLSSEEKAAFAQLHTYKPNTTIYNDVGAYMAAEYVADTKTYVDRRGGSGGSGGSSVTLGTVTLLANKWQGTTDPYSQVVSIAGVTANSQVDLKPSVAQLAIFHDKDLAFVTENDGGIVTVYAIGDKPENDYTIQVSITEVNV